MHLHIAKTVIVMDRCDRIKTRSLSHPNSMNGQESSLHLHLHTYYLRMHEQSNRMLSVSFELNRLTHCNNKTRMNLFQLLSEKPVFLFPANNFHEVSYFIELLQFY